MMIQYNYFSSWLNEFFNYMGVMICNLCCSRGCFGSCVKPAPITAVDEPTKGLKIQGRAVKRQLVVSNEFWSTSSGEFDRSTLQSQTSALSINTSNRAHTRDAIRKLSHSDTFINQGLILWKQTRLQWLGNGKEQTQQSIHEPTLSWNATNYQSLLGTSKPFAQRVPLPEMIEFLVHTWEREGMYD